MAESTSQEVLEKVEFYFLALVFTLLGATIQTASFSTSPKFSVTLELVAWALLATSGIAGLSKLYWVASIVHAKERKQNYESLSRELKLAEYKGVLEVRISETDSNMPIGEALSKVEGWKEKYNDVISKLGKPHEMKHHIQWWCFVFGLVSVGVARGFAAIC